MAAKPVEAHDDIHNVVAGPFMGNHELVARSMILGIYARYTKRRK
jgi:hypothetical protein